MDRSILERYDSAAGAESYTKKFSRHWNEHLNNWFEQRLIRGLLREVGSPAQRVGRCLDCPCGYGRIYPLLREVAEAVVEADYSGHLLARARMFQAENPALGPAEDYVQANALDLPFADASFDLVFSARLCHHIRTAEERVRYVEEILRVSKRWVLFTYFDKGSWKNRMRELRRRFSKKRAKWTMSRAEVAELAAAQGFRVVRSVPLSRLFSGHRYTLLRRD